MEELTPVPKIYELYVRTLRNCYHYKEKKQYKRLLNEIGVLRGLAMALEVNNVNIRNREFDSYISLQNALIERK